MALNREQLETEIKPIIIQFLRGKDPINKNANELSGGAKKEVNKLEKDYVELSESLSELFSTIITNYIKSADLSININTGKGNIS